MNSGRSAEDRGSLLTKVTTISGDHDLQPGHWTSVTRRDVAAQHAGYVRQNRAVPGMMAVPAPGDPAPGDTVPGDPKPGDPKPGDSLPGDSLPGDTLPEASRRRALASDLLGALRLAIPGSDAILRGSLALGADDAYSDIDIGWVVGDGHFPLAANSVGASLQTVRPVTALRLDPDFALSDRRRLVYVRLAGVPLFWRVDVDVRAASVSGDDDYDRGNPRARSRDGWSRPGSAIENAVAALKAALRGQPAVSASLLRRGFERIGLDADPAMSFAESVVALAECCAARVSQLAGLAEQIRVAARALA